MNKFIYSVGEIRWTRGHPGDEAAESSWFPPPGGGGAGFFPLEPQCLPQEGPLGVV